MRVWTSVGNDTIAFGDRNMRRIGDWCCVYNVAMEFDETQNPRSDNTTQGFGKAESYVMASMIIGMMFMQTIVSPRTGSGSS